MSLRQAQIRIVARAVAFDAVEGVVLQPALHHRVGQVPAPPDLESLPEISHQSHGRHPQTDHRKKKQRTLVERLGVEVLQGIVERLVQVV
jgi:hypothetical protein